MPPASPLKDPRFVGSFTAIVTPFTADSRALDLARLDAQIAFQADGGTRGIVVAGTTGEAPTLEEEEYRALVRRAVAQGHARGLLVIAGTGSNSTAHACELQRFAADAGCDAALSVNPYYNKPTQDGLVRHFEMVADAAPIPVVLYNIPGRTGVALAPATVERFAAHPRIVANKEATGSTDSASEIIARCPGLVLLSGDDSMTLPFLSVGACGVVSVASNLVPRKVADLCAAPARGDWSSARAIHHELFDLCRGLFLETNPIPIKAAMHLAGRDSGSLRLPMCPASEGTIAALRKLLARHELLPR